MELPPDPRGEIDADAALARYAGLPARIGFLYVAGKGTMEHGPIQSWAPTGRG